MARFQSRMKPGKDDIERMAVEFLDRCPEKQYRRHFCMLMKGDNHTAQGVLSFGPWSQRPLMMPSECASLLNHHSPHRAISSLR